MVWPHRGRRAAPAHGARARGRKPPLDRAHDEQRCYRFDRPVRSDFSPVAGRRSRRRRFALRLPNGQDSLHFIRRLVRLALRAGFRYSISVNFQKGSLAFPANYRTLPEYDMILEDLQYRYEGLKPRTALVRSYL